MTKVLRACRVAAALFASFAMAGTAQAQSGPAAPASAQAPAHTASTSAASFSSSRVTGAFAAPPAAASPAGLAQAVVKPTGAPMPLSLEQMVSSYTGSPSTEEEHCLAAAVYFEARGESLEGQLAVAKVVLNRAASGRYPTTICKVVTQRAQFSFVRDGRLPEPNRASQAWHNATAIAYIAQSDLARSVPSNVLWYHADYVSPPWGKWHTQVTRIGAHIFYS
jgi:spore germination cell wall hydrolase CwlJ-like protein